MLNEKRASAMRGGLAGFLLERLARLVPVHDGVIFEHEKGIRWMPWHQEAMKDVARCEKPRGAASRL